jgi:hypothetical protein
MELEPTCLLVCKGKAWTMVPKIVQFIFSALADQLPPQGEER